MGWCERSGSRRSRTRWRIEKSCPALRRKPRAGTLFDVELVEHSTAKLRLSVWEVFNKRGLHERLSASTLVKLFGCPLLVALVLHDYGDELYETGFPCDYYRQLLAHLQKRCTLL